MKHHNKESQMNMTPEMALDNLKEGNVRFVENSLSSKNLPEEVTISSQGQFPFATVLGCIDSRVPAELIFDQGIGDIFNVRIAGNIVNEDILGSMEFACKVAGSKVIVVLGHTKCGAVRGAVDQVELGNLTGLLKKIEPAIETVKQESKYEVGDNPFMDAVVTQNVLDAADEIISKSDVLSEMVSAGEIAIVKAVYSVDTGKVDFL